ncbi:MAG: hypothetical protein AAF560_08050 [Acidobacteriota bacterium]
MNDFDPTSVRGRGLETLLPEGGLPFDEAPQKRPATTPEAFSSLTVSEAFDAIDWEGKAARERAQLDLSKLTVEEFFERFRWDPMA